MTTQMYDRMYTTREFAAKFGLAEEYVRQMCREQADFRTGRPVRLPDGWAARKVGNTWMLSRAGVGKSHPPAHSQKVLEAYTVLGLPAGASLSEVRKRHKWLAMANHPDRFEGVWRRQAEEEMKRVNAARDVLKAVLS